MKPSKDQTFVSAIQSLESYFDPDDVHGIWNQLHDITWFHAAFLIANESRLAAIETQKSSSALNGLIGRLIDRGWMSIVSTGIRKLVDKPKSDPKMAVLSLASALHVLRTARQSITRDRFRNHFRSKSNTKVEDIDAQFDILSATNNADRKESDALSFDFIRELESDLKKIEILEMIGFTNKYIAHSADANSRKEPLPHGNSASGSITIAQVEDSIAALYKVAWKIYARVLCNADYILPATPQFDLFEHLDEPWITDDKRARLWDKWRSFEALLDGIRVSNFRPRA